jgi:hypothetical protein
MGGLGVLGACAASRNADDAADGGIGLDSTGDPGQPDASGEKLDVANDGATHGGQEGGGADGCGKIDFLFVVDSSGSMGGKQDNLVASFPGFISTIRDEMQIDDYHIMVVDTDAGGLLHCEALCGSGLFDDCDGVPCDMLSSGDCDATLGGGKIKSLQGMDCAVQGDQRYLVGGQPNLDTTFECIARVGTDGNGDESQMGAMMEALAPGQIGAGGCNVGFVRDDAILVVTVITDEEDDPNDGGGQGTCGAADDDANSPGNPASWRDAVVAAKNGNEQAVVLLALLGDCDTSNGVCGPLTEADFSGAEPTPRLRTFAESFTHGTWASVCSPDYNTFFQEAVSVIDTACDGFVPPG